MPAASNALYQAVLEIAVNLRTKLAQQHGLAILSRWHSLAAQSDRVDRLLARYHAGLIAGIRFAYGLCVVGPVLLGTSSLSAKRFAFFNGVGGAGWVLEVVAQI
jgi:membrane protein DedA with SNARE-associated domain